VDAHVRIGEASEWVGLPEKTIRYYEEIGLVSPCRAENGFRQYSRKDIQSLRVVKKARDLGFSLEDSRLLLALFQDEDRSSADVKALASRKLEQVREKIAQLERLAAKLADLTDQCRGNDDPNCAILDFLSHLH